MSDLIDRQKVLNTLDFADNALIGEGRTIEKYKELLTECIKVLPTAENKGDLISRQAILDELEKWDWQELYLPIHFKENIIDVIPSINPQEPKIGRWKRISMDKYVQHAMAYYKCSECGKDIIGEHNYCPNCGAKMESEV